VIYGAWGLKELKADLRQHALESTMLMVIVGMSTTCIRT